jgi:NAD(P)-dependent dehydrogenase (short-subunit alcohol dehydrogenase family)
MVNQTSSPYLSPPPLAFVANRLAGRVVFVTGASSGIGAAASKRFAAEGALVAVASRRVDQLDAVVDEIRAAGGDAISVPCDVSDEQSVADAVAATVQHFGRLDGAFNNAGAPGGHRLLHETNTADFDRCLTTNLRGPFLCMKYEIPAMLAGGGGSIVNTSSIGGLVGGDTNNDYASSKWGLAGLVKCAALGYARVGIRVNAIAPGPTSPSDMFDFWMRDETVRTAMAEAFPMNYIAHADDMARVALFLLSDEARWITGHVLPCEGGASSD